jgi:hypothetical protein
MDITGVRVVDLGRELSGSVRGPLATWDVVPGNTVTVSMDVVSLASLSANPRYSLQFKRLEVGAQKYSLNNFLVWSNANPAESGWVKYGETKPYFCKDLASGETGNFTFDLHVGESTPVDFYNLEFAVGGIDDDPLNPTGPKRLWYTDEHFYVAVLSPSLLTSPAVTWDAALMGLGYVLECAENVDGPWLTYTNPIGTIEGNKVVLMKTSEGPRKYFRLHKVQQP